MVGDYKVSYPSSFFFVRIDVVFIAWNDVQFLAHLKHKKKGALQKGTGKNKTNMDSYGFRLNDQKNLTPVQGVQEDRASVVLDLDR